MKHIGIFTLLFLILVSFQSKTALPNHQKIVVGAEISYPTYCLTDSLGNPTGYSVELFRAAANAVNIGVVWKSGVWKKLKSELANGQIDALPLVGQNEERAKVFDFTPPYLELSGCIVVNKKNKHLRTIEQLNHSCILVMEGDNAHEYLLNHAVKPNLKTTDTYITALKLLASGECQAVVMQKLLAHQLINDYNLNNLTISNTLNDFRRHFSFAVKKGDAHLLAQLEIGLRIVTENGTQRRLENKWLSTTKDIALRKKTLIVGGDASYPPMEYTDEDGNPAGFNVDLIKAVAREAGLDIRIQLGLWSSVCHKLANGEIDIIQGMHYSHERDILYDYSSPSAFLGQVVICRNDTQLPQELDDLRGKNIVVQEEDINHQFLLRNEFNEELKTVASQEVALEMVAKKISDYALVSRYTATSVMKNKDWDLHAGHEALFGE
jgi:two-component system cell cycle sensor histidine kinase/response regulator CckA